jgi:hypothetical protein
MDSTHIRWLEERLEKIHLEGPKGRRWENRKRSREHDRKEEPKRAPVVPSRRENVYVVSGALTSNLKSPSEFSSSCSRQILGRHLMSTRIV